jgi:hypothetical protein
MTKMKKKGKLHLHPKLCFFLAIKHHIWIMTLPNTLFEGLSLYIVKGYHPLSLIDNPWVRWLVLHQNGKTIFPSWHQLVKDILPNTKNKTLHQYVYPPLAQAVTCTISFDLWMSLKQDLILFQCWSILLVRIGTQFMK